MNNQTSGEMLGPTVPKLETFFEKNTNRFLQLSVEDLQICSNLGKNIKNVGNNLKWYLITFLNSKN